MAADSGERTTPEAARVRAEIEKAREQIHASVLELKDEVATVADWRRWVRRRPALFVGLAFGIGVYLGSKR